MSKDLLSPELRAALGGGSDLVLPSRKKKNGKKKVKRKRAEVVDPALLRMMKKMNKKKRRKFLRSQERKLEKKDRTKIYDKMKKNAISTDHLALLGQSGRVGQDLSRKQKLQRDLRLVTSESRGSIRTLNSYANDGLLLKRLRRRKRRWKKGRRSDDCRSKSR